MIKNFVYILLVIVIKADQQDEYCLFLDKQTKGKEFEQFKEDSEKVDS